MIIFVFYPGGVGNNHNILIQLTIAREAKYIHFCDKNNKRIKIDHTKVQKMLQMSINKKIILGHYQPYPHLTRNFLCSETIGAQLRGFPNFARLGIWILAETKFQRNTTLKYINVYYCSQKKQNAVTLLSPLHKKIS